MIHTVVNNFLLNECIQTFNNAFMRLYNYPPRYYLLPYNSVDRSIKPGLEFIDRYNTYWEMRCRRWMTSTLYWNAYEISPIPFMTFYDSHKKIIGQLQYLCNNTVAYIPNMVFLDNRLIDDIPELLKVIDAAFTVYSSEHTFLSKYVLQLPWPDDAYYQGEAPVVNMWMRKIASVFRGLDIDSLEIAYDLSKIPDTLDVPNADEVLFKDVPTNEGIISFRRNKATLDKLNKNYYIGLKDDPNDVIGTIGSINYKLMGDYYLICDFDITDEVSDECQQECFKLLLSELKAAAKNKNRYVAYRVERDLYEHAQMLAEGTIFLCNIQRIFK